MILLLAACTTTPTTLDTGAPDLTRPESHLEAPDLREAPTFQPYTPDAHSAESDPCQTTVAVDPSPYLLGSEWSEVNGQINSATVSVPTCDLDGLAVVYEIVEEVTVWVQFCGAPGLVVSYNEQGHCFGVTRSTDGTTWGAHPLPGMHLAVIGGQYTLETE